MGSRVVPVVCCSLPTSHPHARNRSAYGDSTVLDADSQLKARKSAYSDSKDFSMTMRQVSSAELWHTGRKPDMTEQVGAELPAVLVLRHEL
jgi:hypothetical protein